MKPIHLVLLAGGALLLSRKSTRKASPAGTDIAKASALATAQAVVEAAAPQAKASTEQGQLKALQDTLVPDSVQGFGGKKPPTAAEFAALSAIDADLPYRSLPPGLREEMAPEIKKTLSFYQSFLNKFRTPSQKIALGLSMMDAREARHFAADCLELTIPAMKRDFSRTPEAVHRLEELIGSIRAFADNRINATALQRRTDEVMELFGSEQNIRHSPIAKAIQSATVTSESLRRLASHDPAQVKDQIMAALRKTKDLAVEVAGKLAFHESIDAPYQARLHSARKSELLDPKFGSASAKKRVFDASDLQEVAEKEKKKAAQSAEEFLAKKIFKP